MVRTWKQALFLVQPETLLRWHHELFRVFGKHKSKVHARMPRLSSETISLIQEMAANNQLWGRNAFEGSFASWVFGEVKRTIQKYMKHTRAISSWWAELENVPTPPCDRDMGLWFFAGKGFLLLFSTRLSL
jgi:hypothetical protein